MTQLIGINGRLRSGKDTAYDIITELLPDDKVVRASFADLLKVSAAIALGHDPVDVAHAVDFCNSIKEGKITTTWDYPTGFPRALEITGREFLQRYGTEAHRNLFGDDFWIKACLPDDWHEHYGHPDVLVVTDVRFTNEAERIWDLNGEVWYVNAEQRLGPLPEDAHPSEHPLPSSHVDVALSNNGTLEEFKCEIRDILV